MRCCRYNACLLSTVALALVTYVRAQAGKHVFAHYLVGTVTQDHVQTDINDALASGISGFSLNIGDPSADFVINTLNYMFDYAPTVGFLLHISMDMSASGGDLDSFDNVVRGYVGKPGYFAPTAGKPFITTFSDGGRTNTEWDDWKQSTLANELYFCPDFDGTQGYTTADPGWWAYWGDTVDCLFSWDASWEAVSPGAAGSAGPGTIEVDQTVLAGAKAHGKNYMMGLSTLQYKNAYGADIYRPGELTLANRIKNILNMSPQPDYIMVITWNDGPESHYVGNIWPESNTDPAPALYVNSSAVWSHAAWRPLINSFANAYLAGVGPQSMAVPQQIGGSALGVMWYKSILQSSVCPNGDHPEGWQLGQDVINWAIVINPGTDTSNYVLKVSNGVATFQHTGLTAGLNSGQDALVAGSPSMELWDGSTRLYVASGGRSVSSGCPDTIFNMNEIVVGLTPSS